MKNVLIISPHFPPVNAPDMQRVRMALPYLKENDWNPIVVAVDEKYVEGFRDTLLNESIPVEIDVNYVKAYSTKYTRKVGLGSLSMRSFFQYKKAGERIIKSQKIDLVFFSTTMFHVCALGRYWKKKFGIPFIIDMQDSWRNDFRLGKQTNVQPLKFKIAYAIDKHLEAYTMPYVDGLISVSQAYIDVLKERYPSISNIPAIVLPFGSSDMDFQLVQKKSIPSYDFGENGKINVLYMGAVTPFFIPIIRAFFNALKEDRQVNIEKYHFYFIGTSYVQASGINMVAELARELGLDRYVTEVPDREPYFNALATLKKADILFVPGSIDIEYNASKIYNNIAAGVPIFSIYYEGSPLVEAIRRNNAGVVCGFSKFEDSEGFRAKIAESWQALINNLSKYGNNTQHDLTAQNTTKAMTSFFDNVVHSQV